MFRFFRIIRQKLLENNQIKKYILYGLGEIGLVVIGILIALAINNWNEEKKVSKDIHAALVEIREDLMIDQASLGNALEIRKEDLAAQIRIIKILENEKLFLLDDYKDLGRIMLKRGVNLIDNGYKLLLDYGISNLKDKELRNALVSYYNYYAVEVQTENDDDEFEFENIWLPYVRDHFRDWQYGEIGLPKDDKQLFKDSYFLTSLKINSNNIESTIVAYDNAWQASKDLGASLDKILDK